MALQRQVHIYSVDTSGFYNEKEEDLYQEISNLHIEKKPLKKERQDIHNQLEQDPENEKLKDMKKQIDSEYQELNNEIKNKKEYFKQILKQNSGGVRTLNPKYICDKNVISVFESSLTRTMGIPTNGLSSELIVVEAFYFEILEDIVLNGFMLNGNKYVVYTASAGQIRTKKTVFIKESVLKEHENKLTCGLTNERINECGGININKYLAYRALQSSATEVWNGFDIDKAIVVEDFETEVGGVFDYIDDETYEIERKKMDGLIPHTDGCGMMLPSFSDKSKMCRAPWIKGLLVPFDFKCFVLEKSFEHKKNYAIVKDIYGKEYDIIKDDIQVIFFKSQFKMYKYYDSWDEYKQNFKKYDCEIGFCNEEPDRIKDAKINYQMLQTLSDMTNRELKNIAKQTIKDIKDVSTDMKTKMKLLGATPYTKHKNPLQQAVQYYPPLLNDQYCKNVLNQVKRSLVKKAKAGKLFLDAKYTFLIPDLYAACEFLFLGEENPKGILKDGEVSCNLYPDENELDCLRSPHLYLEHAVRKNKVKDIHKKWFISKGLYTSCHDGITRILQNDVDGDLSLVCNDSTIKKVAKRNVKKMDVVPLYYNMKKAGTVEVNNPNIYNGLIAAYKGGNIGVYSNNISNVWNSGDIDLDVIKLLCMENNFVIDYAKTLYKPKRPHHIKKKISKYTNKKLPHFFMYAKNKTKNQVSEIDDSVVNRLSKIIKNPNLDMKSIQGRFHYTKLMNNPKINIDHNNTEIVEMFNKVVRDLWNKKRYDDKKESSNASYIYKKIREEMLRHYNDEKYVVDVLIKYFYTRRQHSEKVALWWAFGSVIVDNLKQNLTRNFKYEAIECEGCGILIEKTNINVKYCKDCWRENQLKWQRDSMKKLRSSKNVK